MKLKQKFTKMGKVGLTLFFIGPCVAMGTREWLTYTLASLRGNIRSVSEIPDVTLYHGIITIGVLAFLASIPMIIMGREYEGIEQPKDNGMWR
ncbi:hypothetical protein G6L74_05760 [Agrobacterium tumefaciens]|uniref:hypothetical protein n=1 Tax=Agrobacterium tumefaciens TaxID=358 RepID=UPI001573C1A6|nr:hypothetical protein [Agrobacterium tumefaciens]